MTMNFSNVLMISPKSDKKETNNMQKSLSFILAKAIQKSAIKRCAKSISVISIIALTVILAGCKSGIIDPQGPIASYELKLLIFSTLLMLIVVIPVIFLTFWFAWRYRSSATKSKYRPEWSHSTILEIVWWTIPCIIIAILAVITWKTSHELDPYKPLESNKKPLTVQVVALDWKWLFIYPDYKIATVNDLVIPTKRPINFNITSAAPMNSFIIPQLGGQIYAMAGMTTQLHLLADNPGNYRGFSANYTGHGFAHMDFFTHAVSDAKFNSWAYKVSQSSQKHLSWDYFWNHMVKQSVNDPITHYSSVDNDLFDNIVMYYMMPNYKPGMSSSMMNMSND